MKPIQHIREEYLVTRIYIIDSNYNEIWRRKPIKNKKILDHKIKRLNKALNKIFDIRRKTI